MSMALAPNFTELNENMLFSIDGGATAYSTQNFLDSATYVAGFGLACSPVPALAPVVAVCAAVSATYLACAGVSYLVSKWF